MLLEYKTDRRGYTMWLERDLIGSFVLHRRWYGLHNRRGGMKRQVFECEQDALKEVRRVMRLRERHGYSLLLARCAASPVVQCGEDVKAASLAIFLEKKHINLAKIQRSEENFQKNPRQSKA